MQIRSLKALREARRLRHTALRPGDPRLSPSASPGEGPLAACCDRGLPVSYTHLTLPTICSV
eukprot:10872367-Alexandrium_andersonii.AAC.1